MMKTKAYIDTNVFLDLFLEGRKSTPAVNAIFQCVLDGQMEAVLTTQSIMDAYYVHCEEGKNDSEEFFRFVNLSLDYVNVDYLSVLDLRWARRNFSGDYEDDAQVSRAIDTCCDIFLTNDKKLRARNEGKHGHLRFLSPEAFVQEMKDNMVTPS